MTKSILSLFFVIITYSAVAQLTVHGKVVDTQTEDPLGFGVVRLKNTSHGVLTNDDGRFSIKCNQYDTLIVSYLSYVTVEVPVDFFVSNSVVKLSPKKNQLTTVIVSAEDDYLYDMIVDAKTKLKRQSAYDAKTYFMLETSTEDQPIEQIECYYNGYLTKDGISELDLKNGRIGMAAYDNDYFVSLNTTNIVEGYKLTKENTGNLPSNPLQLSKKKMKKHYKLTLIGLSGSQYRIKFVSKRKQEDYFNGEIWIDADRSKIMSLTVNAEDLEHHPFVPIHPKHKIERLDYAVTYTFDEVENKLSKIDVSYGLSYHSNSKTKWINSSAVFLVYDYDDQFHLPYYNDESLLSDYDKIVSRPYNPLFWQNNEVLVASEKALKQRAFFEENGVLLNFDKLSMHYEQFANRKKRWSERRIFRDEINSTELIVKQQRNLGPRVYVSSGQPVRADFYDLNAQIFLDVNTVGDSMYFISSTLIDLDQSYFGMKPNKYSTCFINLYFDIHEMYRRDLLEKLNSKAWSHEGIDTLYEQTMSDLKFELFQFRTAFLGFEDRDDIDKYVAMIQEKLEIDNSLLILPDESIDFAIDHDEYVIDVPNEKYFYALNLAKKGNHDVAVEYLLDYALTGRQHQWLYQRLGQNYRALDKHELSCQFFDLCKSFGGELTKEEEIYCEEKN